MQSAAAAGSPALAALLKATPEAQLENGSTIARNILYSFLSPVSMVRLVARHDSSALLVDKFWQRVKKYPAALAATVEALRACHQTDVDRFQDRYFVGEAVQSFADNLQPGSKYGRGVAAWTDVVGSDSLQQYAMDALTPQIWEASPSQSLTPEQLVQRQSQSGMEPFMSLLTAAAAEGKLCETRLRALLTHDSLLAPLRAAAEDCKAFKSVRDPLMLLQTAWFHFRSKRVLPAGSPEAYLAAQTAMLEAARQGGALLQLRALAPAKQQRALRRALSGGFFQVHPSNSVPPEQCLICEWATVGL